MKKKLLTGLLALTMAFSLIPMSGSVWADGNNDNTPVAVTFVNEGYPAGKNMTDSGDVTLVMDVDGTATSYQWQIADSEGGDYTDIENATSSEYSISSPESGKWYRCVVDGTSSKAVEVVKPNSDDRTWTEGGNIRFSNSYYISNGTMAYNANGVAFDIVGLYTAGGAEYMLQTAFWGQWDMFSTSEANPAEKDIVAYGDAQLDALRIAFDENNAYAVTIEADLKEGQQSFAFGTDTMLGDENLFGQYSDYAVLQALVEGEQLKQISMIAAESLSNLTGDEGAFVIKPEIENCFFCIGAFNARKAYGYNTVTDSDYVKGTTTIGGEDVVTLYEGNDSGMGISWTNLPSGGSVKFGFAVGSVSATGAAKVNGNAGINYVNETITGLDANTTYNITSGNDTYSITSDSNGTISLTGTANNGKSYDFMGKTISLVKAGGTNSKTFEIAGRPATPEKLSDSDGSIEHGTDYFIITPASGLQYAYSTDGINWTILTDADKDSLGRYYVKGLSANQVYISTRVIATDNTPASAWTEAATLVLKTDGKSATGTAVTTPKTGDGNNLVLWGSLLACGMAALGSIVVISRRKQNVK